MRGNLALRPEGSSSRLTSYAPRAEGVARRAETFDADVERIITELDAPDCSLSGVQLGHEKLRKFELRVLAPRPDA